VTAIDEAAAERFVHAAACVGGRLESTTHAGGQVTLRCLNCAKSYLALPDSAAPPRSDAELAELAAAEPEARAEEAELAARLAEVQARRVEATSAALERRRGRGEEWDRRTYEGFDLEALQRAEAEARAAFVAAVVRTEWGAALVAARRARNLAINASMRARDLHERYGQPNTPAPVETRYWPLDLGAELGKVLEDEANRQAADEIDEGAAAREAYIEEPGPRA